MKPTALHYGFLVSPTIPHTPQHKGKVESGVHYVKRNFLAGQEFVDITVGNEHLRRWVRDIACADYLTALISNQQPDPAPFIERVYRSTSGQMFTNPANPKLPEADLHCAIQVDQFDFAMQVQRQGKLLVLNKV